MILRWIMLRRCIAPPLAIAVFAWLSSCSSAGDRNTPSVDAGRGVNTGSGGANAANGGATSAGASSSGSASNGGATTAAGTSNGGATTAAGTSNGGATTAAGGASSAAGASHGGATTAAGGASSGAACKRGIAANTPPGAAFHPAIGWWYNWSMKRAGTDVGIEFAPMIRDKSSVGTVLPAGSKYLLTFNEPNFHSQADLTAAQAASYWPQIETAANAAHVPIVSPAMNFCGPETDCNGTNPYQYLKDFFAGCSGCKVDYVAVHWYNCDLPSLQDYLEPGGHLEGFEQFGKPIWLTEFSCDGSASVADQEKYMRAAIPYLESNAHVFRYSWFSAGPIPNAQLLDSGGSPTALGKVYIGLDGACH